MERPLPCSTHLVYSPVELIASKRYDVLKVVRKLIIE
jgi:hypothetical protein